MKQTREERRGTEVQFIPKKDAQERRLAAAISGDGGIRIIDMIKEGNLTEDQIATIQRELEINGYSKKDMFYLPFSFVERILGAS